MTSETRIGPDVSLDDLTLPAALAERLGQFYGADGPLRTGAAWIDAMDGAFTEKYDRVPTVEDLCTSADGAHTFDGPGTTQSYVCVLDPLAYPFLTGTPGAVRSETPVRGTEVAFEIGEDGVDLSHEDAVISIGVSDDVDADSDPELEAVYREICGYIHAFEDSEEYGTWAADAGGTTTSVPAREGVAIAREIATGLFDAGRHPSRAEGDPG